MKDILLDSSGDLYIDSDGDIAIGESIVQAISIRLKWFEGEWAFNETLGIPYFDDVFIKNPSLSRIEQIIAEEIRSVDGISSVISVTATMNAQARTLSVAFSAYAGEEYINEEVNINV